MPWHLYRALGPEGMSSCIGRGFKGESSMQERASSHRGSIPEASVVSTERLETCVLPRKQGEAEVSAEPLWRSSRPPCRAWAALATVRREKERKEQSEERPCCTAAASDALKGDKRRNALDLLRACNPVHADAIASAANAEAVKRRRGPK